MELTFPIILDGATGTQLQKRGYANQECAESWVLKNPRTIQEIQKNYIEAGSMVLYSPTFGANRVKLEENGIFNKVDDYNKRLTALSRQVADDPDRAGRTLVAGDIAPTGKFLAPLGDTTFEEMVEIYTEQAKALEEAGADLFVIETMMTVPEARAALLAVKSVSRKPVFVTFTCDKDGRTLTGTDVAAALLIMQGMGADAFGLNCSVGPEDMLAQLKRLSSLSQVPLIAKPNAGVPVIKDGKMTYNCPPEEFARALPEFARAGVMIFGGCCGTDENYIKLIAETAGDLALASPTSFEEKNPGQLPLATEKETALIPSDTPIGRILPCNEELGEAIEEAGDSPDAVITIQINTPEELDDFADNQFAINKPLCIMAEDASLLEEALRLYQGRAMYEGNLPEEALRPLSKKYGLVY